MSEPRSQGTLLSRTFRVAVLLAAVALLGFSWYTQIQNRRLHRFTRELLAAREYPYMLTGLRLEILAESELLAASAGISVPFDPGRELILVSSDECGFCKQNLPRWQELLARLEPAPDREVWLLTFNSIELFSPLVDQLERSHIAYRVLRVRDPILFSLRTGIVGVPLTMVVGPDRSVEVICSGGLGAREIAIFQDHLNGVASPQRAQLVSQDPRTDGVY